MKKHLKLITLLLTVALLLQIAPLSAIGEDATVGTYTDPSVTTEVTETVEPAETEPAPAETEVEPEVTETVPAETEVEPEVTETVPAETEVEPEVTETVPTETEVEPEVTETVPTETEVEPEVTEPAPAETEVEPEVTETIPAETETEPAPVETEAETENKLPVTVHGAQWQYDIGSSDYLMLNSTYTVRYNHIRMRVILTGVPETYAVYLDGQLMTGVELVGQSLFFDVEMNNGHHVLYAEVSDGEKENNQTFVFYVEGDTSYPEVHVDAPDTFAADGTADILLNAFNFDTTVNSLSAVIRMDEGVQVPSVEFAKGVSGMFFWYRGELNIAVNIEDPSLITNNVLATVKARSVSASSELNLTIVSSDVAIKDGLTIGTAENYVSKVTYKNDIVLTATSYGIRHIPAYGYTDTAIFIISNQDHETAPEVHLYDADTDEYLGTSDSYGLILVSGLVEGQTYRVYCRDDNGISSTKIYEFTF